MPKEDLLSVVVDYKFFPEDYRERIKKACENPSRYERFSSDTFHPNGFFPDGKDRISTHRDLLRVIGAVHPSEINQSSLLALLEKRFRELPEIGKKSSRMIAGYVLVRGIDEFIHTNDQID